METVDYNAKLAAHLTAHSLLSAEQAKQATQQAEREAVPLYTILAAGNMIDAVALLGAAGQVLGLPVIDPSALDCRRCPLDLLEAGLANECLVLPLARRGRQLWLAMADPTKPALVDEIARQSRLKIMPVLAPADGIRQALSRARPADAAAEGTHVKACDRGKAWQRTIDANLLEDERQVVRFVDDLLAQAIRSGASDIHIEPYERSCRIRFRYDGLLQEVAQPPLRLINHLVARCKVLAQLDISEKRLPQDGRLQVRVKDSNRPIDFRLNTLPTLWGEKLVLRVLDTCQSQLEIDRLGMEPQQQRRYLEALRRRQGLILVTGPTGSGKTVSLYSGLRFLNEPECNIATVEDPVEIYIEGINQVAVRQKPGLTFAVALRAFLRQDPDVIMIGEIRDGETADIAVKAAQTGHLVLSTLHTNSASETLNRLLSMGVAGFNLATGLSLIMAQRLLRRLCPHCKVSAQYPDTVLKKAGFAVKGETRQRLFTAGGCADCHQGYRGRIGIYEVVPITPALSRIIMKGDDPVTFSREAHRAGFTGLRQAALRKVALGVTSLEEANRLT